MKSLELVRKEIDKINSELLEILNKRMDLVLKTMPYKESFEDKEREKEMLEELFHKAKLYSHLDPNFIKEIFSAIITESKRLQEEKSSN